ncbi:MAG TPA: TetR family transcriptional regulator, partial [Polyangiaceae bacterium]|nr:TetR family transcriptional regulator [Polyangiaceae bacterium]
GELRLVTAAKTRGRRTGSAGDTRARILSAARGLFAQKGFQGTTLRAVAARARVDMALVSYFFGSKDQLFERAIELSTIADGLGQVLRDRSPGLGERVVRYYLERVFVENEQAVAAILRTAVTDAKQLRKLRALLGGSVTEEAARALGPSNGKLRAELLGAQVTGLFLTRYIVRVEPLASASVAELAALLGPAIELILGLPSPRPNHHEGPSHRRKT